MREATDERRHRARRGGWVGLLAVLVACSAPPWSADQLAARHPELSAHPGQRLADVRPFYLPGDGQVTLFLCRWPVDTPVPVAIAGEASADERRAVRVALAAWEQAGLGVRFAPVAQLGDAGIEIVFKEGILSWTASTLAQCEVADAGSARATRPGGALTAQMRAASIQLGRNDPRLVGSILHELGHALGFQGHPRRGASIMRRDAKALLETSVRVGKGGAFSDATLAALYAVPSGTVLARLPLPAGRTASVDALAAVARSEGWAGPFLQVGDNAGRVGWRTPRGERLYFRLGGLRAALENPARFSIEPEERTARWLESEIRP